MFSKIVHQLIDLEVQIFFDISNSNMRGHNFKIKRFGVNNNGNEFSDRSVNVWNSLPDTVLNCNSLSLFRYKLNSCSVDKYCAHIHLSYLCNIFVISFILYVLHFILLQTVAQLHSPIPTAFDLDFCTCFCYFQYSKLIRTVGTVLFRYNFAVSLARINSKSPDISQQVQSEEKMMSFYFFPYSSHPLHILSVHMASCISMLTTLSFMSPYPKTITILQLSNSSVVSRPSIPDSAITCQH